MDTRFSSKQALWFTLINYIGVLIGTVSTLFIYPQDTELLGVFRFVDGFAQVLYPVLVLGASTALLNFQPKLNTYLQRKLFTYSLFSVFAMILFCCVGIYAIYQIDVLKNKEYFSYGFVIAVCLAYVDVFKRQATNLQKLAVPTFYEKVMPKLALPFVFLLILKTGLDTKQGLTLYAVAFVLVL